MIRIELVGAFGSLISGRAPKGQFEDCFLVARRTRSIWRLLNHLRSPIGWFIAAERVVCGGVDFVRRLVFYPQRKLLFAEYHWSTTIHPACEFRQRCNIALGPGVVLNRGVIIHAPVDGRVTIGAKSQLNPYTVIYGRVTVGMKAMIAPHAMLVGGNHAFSRLDIPMIEQGSSSKGGVALGDDVWIGANAVILDGVTIPMGTIVAAGCVVTKTVEPYSIVAGVPGRVIGSRRLGA